MQEEKKILEKWDLYETLYKKSKKISMDDIDINYITKTINLLDKKNMIILFTIICYHYTKYNMKFKYKKVLSNFAIPFNQLDNKLEKILYQICLDINE